MNRTSQYEILVFVLLVAAGAGLRLLFQDLPNFAPIAAISLFAGYYFRRPGVALSVPLAAMLISDQFIGGYSWQMMALVYGMLMLPALCGGPLKKLVRLDGQRRSVWRPLGALLTCSLGASLAFFFVTNFGAWVWFDSYAKTWSGLTTCYVAALPFFRYTLAGDILFAALLFGSYALVAQLAGQRRLVPVTSNS